MKIRKSSKNIINISGRKDKAGSKAPRLKPSNDGDRAAEFTLRSLGMMESPAGEMGREYVKGMSKIESKIEARNRKAPSVKKAKK